MAIAQTVVIGTDVREKLTADRTYYVLTTGNNSNTGLVNNAGGAFLTVQRGLDVAFGTLDLGGFNVTIQVGAGTYTTPVSISGAQVGKGNITILGDVTTPSNVFLSVTGYNAIEAYGGATLHLSGLKLGTNGAVVTLCCCIYVNGSAIYIDGNMEYAQCNGFGHIVVQNIGSFYNLSNNSTISGGSSYSGGPTGFHWFSTGASSLFEAGVPNITLTGSPTFSAFGATSGLGYLQCNGALFNGTAVGSRYSIDTGGVIFTNGGGASFLPGNSVGTGGTTAGGGFYN